MASQDETVSRPCILQILERARRDGWESLFRVLEHQEPVLAAFALAAADLLAENLRTARAPERIVGLVHRDMMVASLTCIESMRHASRQLWNDFLPDGETDEKAQ